MSDFKGEEYDFAAGSIHGIRSWGMDDLGRLHGVTHREVWRPGENVAVCKATKRVPCPNRAALDKRPVPRRESDTWLYEFRIYSGGSCNEPGCYEWMHPAPTDHTFDPNCECGFWAYDEHTFTEHGDVTGIIQGYGKTTIGTRGFRCEKARIVALARERDDNCLSLSAWMRLQQLYPEAKFYDDIEAMVVQHGAVLRSWPQLGEDFWDKPVKSKDEGMWTLPSTFMPRFWRTGGVV